MGYGLYGSQASLGSRYLTYLLSPIPKPTALGKGRAKAWLSILRACDVDTCLPVIAEARRLSPDILPSREEGVIASVCEVLEG